MGIEHLTKANFLTKVLNYEANPEEWKYVCDKPTIVDFYASWCAPCRRLAVILDELAEMYNGQISIYKVDIELEQELAEAFNIQMVPTLLFIPINGPLQIQGGVLSKATLIQTIQDVLLKG
ncbi:MAG: thioredoxin fold domain-containing protein [Bacteroidales bacterium]|jgi:thioredoxin|nr:thioredoxin fold domain-containing protein [Bacteroidales bacterium]